MQTNKISNSTKSSKGKSKIHSPAASLQLKDEINKGNNHNHKRQQQKQLKEDTTKSVEIKNKEEEIDKIEIIKNSDSRFSFISLDRQVGAIAVEQVIKTTFKNHFSLIIIIYIITNRSKKVF